MIPAFPIYLFDLDGTIMDSAADITGALREVLAPRGILELEDHFLRGYIGYHLIDFFEDLGIPESEVEPMVDHYRRIYPLRKHRGTNVYPGVAEMLGQLGGRKSTATTKATSTTRGVLEQFGLIQHFDHVQGTDGFPHKPEPDVLLKSIELFGAAREDCLFIGDSAADMEAGRRAGVKTCAVRWGYGDHEKMAHFEPDYWIDDPGKLLPVMPK